MPKAKRLSTSAKIANLVKLGIADARTMGLRPIKGLLDMERCVTLKFGNMNKVTQIGYISEIYSVEIFTFESSLARAVNSSCIWSPLRQEKLRLRLLRQARPLKTKIIFRSL